MKRDELRRPLKQRASHAGELPRAALVAVTLACAGLAAACAGDAGSGFGSTDDDGGSTTTTGPGGDAGTLADSSGGSSDTGAPPGSDGGSVVTPADSGPIAIGTPEAGATGDAAAACTMGSAGVLGLIPGATMSPGLACVSCHATTGAGKLNFAGTVFPTLHEGDNCIGSSAGLQVIVTDAQGTDHALSVNSSGNFYDNSLLGFSTPYTARVVGAAGTVAMISKQTSGDCNSCHTSAGAQGAAGRIVGP